MDAIARHLGLDPLAVRKANYYGKTERNVTHYYQTVEHNMLEEMTAELEQSSQYAERHEAIRSYHATRWAEPRVGTEGANTCRTRWSATPYQKTQARHKRNN